MPPLLVAAAFAATAAIIFCFFVAVYGERMRLAQSLLIVAVLGVLIALAIIEFYPL